MGYRMGVWGGLGRRGGGGGGRGEAGEGRGGQGGCHGCCSTSPMRVRLGGGGGRGGGGEGGGGGAHRGRVTPASVVSARGSTSASPWGSTPACARRRPTLAAQCHVARHGRPARRPLRLRDAGPRRVRGRVEALGEPPPRPSHRPVPQAAPRISACCSTTRPTTSSRSAEQRSPAPPSWDSTRPGSASTCCATSSTPTSISSSPSRATSMTSPGSTLGGRPVLVSHRFVAGDAHRQARSPATPISTPRWPRSRRRPRPRARPVDTVGAGVHLRHLGRAEGGDLLAAPSAWSPAAGWRRSMDLGPDDVGYVGMPLFHSNALMVGWAPSIVIGASVGLARRFTRVRLPPRRPPLRSDLVQLHGQAAVVPPRRRPSGPTTPTTRCVWRSATRVRRRCSTSSRGGSASR